MNEVIALLKSKGLTDAEINALITATSKEKKNTYKVARVIRLYWAEKPSKEDREAMSAAGFHWNSFEKFWYADATDAAIKFAGEHHFEEAK